MEKSEITLRNTVLDNVWRYLYDQVKMLGGRTIEYSKLVKYQDGTSNNVTYRSTVQYVQPPQNNRLVINFTLVIEAEGKPPRTEGELMPAIEFTGWQLQTNTVLIKAEFAPLYKSYVDDFWNDLNNKFEQAAQPTIIDTDTVQAGGIPRKMQVIQEWMFSGLPEELARLVAGIALKRRSIEFSPGMVGLDTPLDVINVSPAIVEIRLRRFQSPAQGKVIGELEPGGTETRMTVFLPDSDCVENPNDGWAILYGELSKRQKIRKAIVSQKPMAQSTTVDTDAGQGEELPPEEQAAEKAYKRHLLSETDRGQEKINNIIFADVVILKATLPIMTAELNIWNKEEEYGLTYYPGSGRAAWKGDGFVLTARERSKNLEATGIGVEWVGECTQEARDIWDELFGRLLEEFGKSTQMFPRDYGRIARKTLALLHPSYVMTKEEESEWNAKKIAERERRVSMTADEIVAEFLGGASAGPTGGEQGGYPSKPEKKRKILFEGTLPTTPEILPGILHDFWLNRAPSLEGTAISRMQFEHETFDEHASYISVQLGNSTIAGIATIQIKRLNDQYIRITIPSTEGNLTLFRGELWDEISRLTDQFLLDFAVHLKKLYSGNEEQELPKRSRRKSTKFNLPSLPSRKRDAYRWVLIWDKIESKIRDDPSLKTNYHELHEYLKSSDLAVEDDTMRKIITLGETGKIPSLSKFEIDNKM